LSARFEFVKAISFLILAGFVLTTSAHAVNLATLISACGDDAKLYCKGVSYGSPMQVCLIANKGKLKVGCRSIAMRLEKGEKVRLFGN
jgi:hypothetical protein